MNARHDDMPCGCCAAGTYAAGAIREGLRMFGGMETRRQALTAAPRCINDNRHICFGARDFIISCDFPLIAERVAEIEGYISQ